VNYPSDPSEGAGFHSDNLSGRANDDEAILAGRSLLLNANSHLVCLNFKVPLRVRQNFKIYAARNNVSMTELLLRLFDDCLANDARCDLNALTKPEIKK